MTHLTGCEIGDVFCAARPGPPKAGRGSLAACFICGRRACLSCAVRLEVRMPLTGRTLGAHMVCHACAQRVQDGPEAVRRHFSLMGGRGVPSQAPEAPSRVVVSPPVPPKSTKRKSKPQPMSSPIVMKGARPAPLGTDTTSFWSTTERPVEAPACPHHILKELGYVR